MISNREEWVSLIRDVSLLPNSPVVQRDGKWAIAQRKEAWEAVGPRLFDEHLDRFRAVAVEVLRERDPQFELEPDQRFAANIHGKTLKHSHELRKGVAETLALLGSLPHALTSCTLGKAEVTATLAVREILDDADSVLWGSLNHHLPVLAEAAPDEFLDAVERAIATDPSPFRQVFEQESAGVMGRNYMTGLLWALETLAWHPDFLTRVIVILGDLAAMDPGGNWANRPANSAKDILLPWHPQTCADVPKRKAAVTALLQEQPAVGWRILLALLPETHGVTSGTRKPEWRSFIPPTFEEKVTNAEYWEQVSNYAQLAVDAATHNRDMLPDVIERLPHLPEPTFSRLLEDLGADATRELPEPDRRPIWESLVTLGARHRKYADADWAMPSEAVARIEDAASKLAPKSASLLHRRLFSDRDFDLYEEKGDYEEQQRALTQKREEAVKEIIAASGIDGVVEFSKTVHSPWQVGIALGFVGDPASDAALLPAYLVAENRSLEKLAAGFVWGRYRSKGWAWVDGIDVQGWDGKQRGALLTNLPFCRETWERADRMLGTDQSPYWGKVGANPYGPAEDDLVTAIEELLRYGRAQSAVQCAERLTRDKPTGPVDLVIEVLRQNLVKEDSGSAFDQHATLELIKWLQGNPDTPADKLFQTEWSYLPLLDRHRGGSPKTLMRRLASDPAFFCDVIRAVFRSKNVEGGTEDVSAERRLIAENAYRLLNEWTLPPGSDEQGHLDVAAFKAWVDEVKRSSSSTGHFEVAMSQLGQVLPYAPPDPDGLWIHRAVAEVLNGRDGERIRSGFNCELFNMRGVHGFSGGREEREIAAGFREKADAAETRGFHRLATSLRELAASYERDAERESKRNSSGE